MEIRKTAIAEVLVLEPRVFGDDRGFFFESWNQRAFDAAAGPVEVAGSPLLLRELFSNLVDNAIRYTPPSGEVTVHVQPRPAQVTIVDSGSGIPETERERVFERFHRVLGTQASGSGLGLAIVRTIADLHRATVRAEPASAAGGTRFVVAFPAG